MPNSFISPAKCLRLTQMRCVWKYVREKNGRQRKSDGAGGDPWGQIPILSLMFVIALYINAKGPDSVPAKHSVMFSEWLQEQIGPKSFNSVLKYNRVSGLLFFFFFFFLVTQSHMLRINGQCCFPVPKVRIPKTQQCQKGKTSHGFICHMEFIYTSQSCLVMSSQSHFQILVITKDILNFKSYFNFGSLLFSVC